MKTAVITGGSRGIGLEFVRQFLQQDNRVVTGSRTATESQELDRLLKRHGEEKLLIRNLDVGDEDSRRDFFIAIGEELDRIDYLINCAGVVSGDEKSRTAFGSLDQDELSKTFLINTIAPLMLVEEACALLKNGDRPVVANISSSNGSIAQRNVGGKYSYCASKAALNMITRILAADLRETGITVVSFHPGWVKTRMTRNESAPMEAADSVAGMMRILDVIDMGSSGMFLDWEGNEMPW
ncbi:SDR family oxidoreductase [Candidatus Bipolaricaulota bacterium]